MAGVTVRGIIKSFGSVEVLKKISLDIKDREFITLVGPSGCGKSTLLRIIAGLEPQDRGQVLIGNRSVDDLPPRHRDVAMVFQSYALYPHMTAGENIALPLKMRQLSTLQRLPVLGRLVPGSRAIRGEITKEVRKVAEMLELQELLHRKPRHLSGGQRQRVAVGRALVRHPQVFLMDEPLSNLDAALRVQMRSDIAELHKRIGVTFIYVTHDQAEAMVMSDRVAVMMDGQILQIASPAGIYSNPEHIRVAKFIGSPKINILDGSVRSDDLIGLGEQAIAINTGAPAGTKVYVGMRPECIDVDITSGEGVKGLVKRREYLGSEFYIYVKVDSSENLLTVKLSPDRAEEIKDGTKVSIRPQMNRVLLFDDQGQRLRLKPQEFRDVKN